MKRYQRLQQAHEIKIWKQYADDILSGKKVFEIRKNDRDYQVGDILQFKVTDQDGVPKDDHDLNRTPYEITYIHSGLGLQEGYVVMSIKRLPV